MKMKRIILALLCCVTTAGAVKAQDHDLYKSALGVRLGIYPGISYKIFFSDVSAFEILGQSKYNGIIGTVLYEAHWQAFGASRLHWILGLGGHVGVYNAGELKDPDGDVYEEAVTTIGIDAILGIEYYFEDAPLTLGLDIKPFAGMINPGPDKFDAALTIRYAFR